MYKLIYFKYNELNFQHFCSYSTTNISLNLQVWIFATHNLYVRQSQYKCVYHIVMSLWKKGTVALTTNIKTKMWKASNLLFWNNLTPSFVIRILELRFNHSNKLYTVLNNVSDWKYIRLVSGKLYLLVTRNKLIYYNLFLIARLSVFLSFPNQWKSFYKIYYINVQNFSIFT